MFVKYITTLVCLKLAQLCLLLELLQLAFHSFSVDLFQVSINIFSNFQQNILIFKINFSENFFIFL